MKFTLSWLKEHLDTKASLNEITDKLSAIGLEVESVDDPAAKLGPFRVARIVEARKHPNAEKIQVVMVEVEKGKPPLEVVCGAPNARTGLVGVFAPLGTYIPGSKITLEKKPVRGIVSNGMLVSPAEIEISDDHDGIIELAEELGSRVGNRYIDVLGLNDPVVEVKRHRGVTFANAVALRTRSASGGVYVKGTIFQVGERHEPRLVQIDEYDLDAAPEGRILIVRNLDKPGVIGSVGTLLGQREINVAQLHVGRGPRDGRAMMLWNIDGEIDPQVVDAIRKLPHIEHAQPVAL